MFKVLADGCFLYDLLAYISKVEWLMAKQFASLKTNN
jgi:hypothetical protein